MPLAPPLATGPGACSCRPSLCPQQAPTPPPSSSSQIINGTDILEVMHDYTELTQFVHSLHYCRYDEFFRSLSKPCLATPTACSAAGPAPFFCSVGGGGASLRLLPGTAHALFHQRDAHQGLHTAARVLPLPLPLSHGHELWRQHRVH